MKAAKQLNDLPKRALISLISALLLFGLIFFAEYPAFRPVFTAAVAAIAACALWEYLALVRRKELEPPVLLTLVFAVLYVFAQYFKTAGTLFFFSSFWQNFPEIVLGLSFFACFAYGAFLRKSPLLNIAATFFGIIYIAIPLGLMVRIAYFFIFGGLRDPFSLGSFWLFFLIAVTKSADMGGYFVGRSFGKRKLAVKLSPNKTLEGALGGLFCSVIMALFVLYIGKQFGRVFFDVSYLTGAILGFVLGILGQIGDLAESLLKRDVGVKDSNTLAGVGGILDMVDSLLFTAPALYLFLKVYYL